MASFNELCAACTRVTPPGRPSRLCNAVDPGSVAEATSPKLLVFTLEGWVFCPINCRTLPASVMPGGTTPDEAPATLSASRPDQPVVAPPCGTAVCHSLCWSECEYRFNGKGTALSSGSPFDPRGTGCNSVPTFIWIARRLLVLYSGAMGAKLGCNP